MDNDKRYPVMFNAEHKALYDDLVSKGLVKRSWAEFVKDAFYTHVESLDIPKLTSKQFEQLTQQAAVSQKS